MINVLKTERKQYYLSKDQNYDDNDNGYKVKYGAERITIIHLYDPPHLLKGTLTQIV